MDGSMQPHCTDSKEPPPAAPSRHQRFAALAAAAQRGEAQAGSTHPASHIQHRRPSDWRRWAAWGARLSRTSLAQVAWWVAC